MAAFQRLLPHHSSAQAAAGREQPQTCTSSLFREAQKQSVTTRAPPCRDQGPSKPKTDLQVVLQAKKSSPKKPLRPWPRAYEGSPLWGREAFTAVHGTHATYGVPRCSDLQRAHISVSFARKCSGGEMLAAPSSTKLAALITPEASLERLDPLLDY